MSANVPYQAYKSKRQSRNLSILQPNPPSPTTVEQLSERPSTLRLPASQDPDSTLSELTEPSNRPLLSTVSPPPRRDSLQISVTNPQVSLDGSPLTRDNESKEDLLTSLPPQAFTSDPQLGPNGGISVSLPSSSSQSHEPSVPSSEGPRQRTRTMSSSKFRHVPFRNSIAGPLTSGPTKPSPLAFTLAVPNQTPVSLPPSPLPTARTDSNMSTESSRLHFESDPKDVPTFSGSVSPSSSSSFLERNSPSPLQHIDRERTLSERNPHRHMNGSQSASLDPPPGANDLPQHMMTAISKLHGRSAPYRPGFQPKGLYRHRTDEYLDARANVHNDGKVERQRLERRLEKIIDLHFGQKKPKPPSNRRNSSFFDIDFSGKGANTLWRGVLESRLNNTGDEDIRTAEQAITPWENDQDIKNCPICSASFHPLTNRKHHCRTCGRVICSLPVKPPTRVRLCSILFVADSKTGQIEEVEEGVDYGVKRRPSSSETNASKAEDKFLRGVRICQDCRHILLRKQHQLEMRTPPVFARLHGALVALEEEIAGSLASFEDLIHPSGDVAQAQDASESRKNLLQSFSDYEALAKRIRNLPIPSGTGSSQDRIQRSIANRATLFLQKNMLPLKALPKHKKRPSSSTKNGNSVSPTPDPDYLLANKLQPLLEQEAILEAFIEEARMKRRFDDVKSLTANLTEIREEIEKFATNNQL